MSDLRGLFFPYIFSFDRESPLPSHTPPLVPSSFFSIPLFKKKVEKENSNLLSS